MKINNLNKIIRIYFIILGTVLVLFLLVLGVLMQLGKISISIETVNIITAVSLTFLAVLSPVAIINEIINETKDSRQAH